MAAEACAIAFQGAEQAFAAILQDGSPGQSRRLVDDYLRAKPAEHACPMATLSIDAARLPKENAFRTAFAEGLEKLTRTIAGDPFSSDRLVVLAAMVGASILGEAVRGTDVATRMQAAVAAYSETID